MSISLFDLDKKLKNFFLYEKNPHIAVAVSGGPDSIALVFILNKWIKQQKGKLTALIVDHRIRSESYFESLETKKYLDTKGINNSILRIAKNVISRGQMSNARFNRFHKMFNYCKENKIFHLFLGHHLDDNIETFVLRKIAGSNFEGLNCMQTVSINGNIQIIRPLLIFSKKEILNYNKKFKLKYFNDPSNKNIKYSRTIVRTYLAENKNIINNIMKDFHLVQHEYKQYKKMIFKILNIILIDLKLNSVAIDVKKFSNLNHELKIKLINILIKFLKNSDFNIKAKKIENIIKVIKNPLNMPFKTHKVLIKKNTEILSFSVN